MNETISSRKNIVYGDIHVGGNFHIGDVTYVVERDFRHSVLFLRIERGDLTTFEKLSNLDIANLYTAQLSIKSHHEQSLASGTPLLREKISFNIPADLFRRSDDFQNLRRLTEGDNLRLAGFGNASPQDREEMLAADLHHAFFSGDIGTVCADFIRLLENRKIEELLLVVSSDDEAVRNLPWEMTLSLLFPSRMGEAKQHLMANSFGLVRSTEPSLAAFQMQGDSLSDAPLKLLFITALPENLGERDKMLEIEHEQRKLIEAIGGLEATGDQRPKIVIEFLDNASLGEIDLALGKRSHDIVHISGHGAYLAEAKQGILYLENDEGDEQQVRGDELAAVLRRHTCVRLLLLSACETAVAGEHGMAEQLARFGIPAVLAMRFAVTDPAATLFTSAFYEQLARGATLTHALAHAREALWRTVQQRRSDAPQHAHLAEWFTPVAHQNQYLGALADPNRYRTDRYNDFYPKSTFLKTVQTKLIGQGFIGRKRYLIQLRQCFRQNRHACLHGLGGLGKTTLAEAFADNYRKRYGHDVLMFRNGVQIEEKTILDRIFAQWKSALSPDEFVAEELKQYLDNKDAPPLQKLQTVLANCLTGRKTILIFDNFEDVQRGDEDALQQSIGSEHLREFLLYLVEHAPPGCHLLFTTRYRVADFEGVVQHLALDKMTYAEQYRHFNFSETLRHIPMPRRVSIHQRLDGHPRAFEFLEGMMLKDPQFDWSKLDASVDKVEARVFENLLLERIDARLNATERAMFETTCVFVTRSPLAALAAVTAETEDTLRPVLATLRDWSLCFWDEKAGLFEVHVLTREWMQRQNRPGEERRKEVANKAGEFFKDRNTPMDDELSIKYFEMAEAWEEFAEVSFRLQGYFQLIGFYQKARDLNKIVLDKNINLKISARAMNWIGMIDHARGDHTTALQCWEASLKISQQIDDQQGESVALNGLALIASDKGDHRDALLYLEASLKISRQIGDRQVEGTTLHNISHIYQARGDYNTALQHLEASLKIIQQIGDRQSEGTTLNNISQIHQARGDYDTALQYLEASLKIIQQFGGRRDNEARTLNNIGQIHEVRGDYESALQYYESSLKIMQQIGDKRGESATLNNLATTTYAKGDYTTALQYLETSLKITQQIGDLKGEGMALNNISQIYQLRSDYDSALQYLEASLKITQQISNLKGESLALNNIGQIYIAKRDYAKALTYLKASLKITQEISDIAGMATTLNNIGGMLFKQNHLEEAIPPLIQAYSIFQKIGSPNVQAPASYLNTIREKIGEARFQEILSQQPQP